jgi:N-acetyl-1-D-myo-inositol-2-amino-2-deoxy-alpha-D-glucopyranoside deacetylase/mycothiol S-conjugate amidase
MATLLFVGAHPDDESFGPGGALAEYAVRGHQVIYACATRGEAGSADAEFMVGFGEPGDMRWAELTAAAQALGLAEVVHLGYRDSGMPGSAANADPRAQINAPLDEVAERVVAVIRRVRPAAVITFDPIGGYRHPDHIHIHRATVLAFNAAGDAAKYPGAGPAFTPQRLYYTVFPKGLLRLAVRVLPLIGRDPRKFGRNGDIDLVDLAREEVPVHCRVPLSREAQARKQRASACHRSQLAGGSQRGGWLVRVLPRLFGADEPFMQAHPPVPPGTRLSRDLLAGA